jgi:hypothetical protein
MTSPLSVGRMGVTLFRDGGAAYPDGERLGRARIHQGAGAGVFLLAPPFRLNADVAYGFDNRWRLHVMTGFAF